jgi:hypothetical protein
VVWNHCSGTQVSAGAKGCDDGRQLELAAMGAAGLADAAASTSRGGGIVAQPLESRALLAAFGAGNVVVYRVGSGAENLVNTGNADFFGRVLCQWRAGAVAGTARDRS